MSRPYRIVVTKVVEQEITADDQSTLRLNLDAVGSPDRAAELLAEALERNGWTEVEPGVWEKDRGDGETMTCDTAEAQVTTTLRVDRTLSEVVRREIRGDTWNWAAGREMTPEELEAVKERAAAQLDARLSGEARERMAGEAQAEATSRLAAGEAERRREVNRLLIEVTAAALKEKAAELGSVEQIEETWDGADFELTIAVRE